MSHPAIIVTPSTPISVPYANVEKTPYAYSSARYLTPPPHMSTMDQRSNVQRAQRRIQLVAALLALLLSAMAFASLVHPALYTKPAAAVTAIEDHASGFLSSLRVGLGDHELRSLRKTSIGNQRLVARKLRKRADHTWQMPRVNASPVAAEPEAEVQVDAPETIPQVQDIPAPSAAELPKIRSIRAVQAQLMREAKARMLKRQEFVRKQQMGGKTNRK